MIRAFCIACLAEEPMRDAAEVTLKDGRKAFKGFCPHCGTLIYKVIT